jgi:hypothetical protein
MWKSIVLCVSLFGGAALGLALGARFVEPAALPAAAVIGLSVIGVVLILAAPTSEAATVTEREVVTRPTAASDEPEAADLPSPPPVAAAVRNRTPALPFEALNS